MPAIRAPERRAYAETALREIQAVAHSAAYAIIFDPANVRLIYAALINQVLYETAYRIVSKRRNDCRV